MFARRSAHLGLVLALLWALPTHATQGRLIALGDQTTWGGEVAQALGRELISMPASSVAQQALPQIQAGDLVIWLVGVNDSHAATDLATYRTIVASGIRTMRNQGARVIMASGLAQGAGDTATYADAVLGMAGYIDLAGVDQHGIAQAMLTQLAPPLEASWRNDVLEVAAWQPGCLYLIGNNRPTQWIGCDKGTYTLYPYGDQAYVPMGRTLVLRNELAQTEIARLAVPPRIVVWFPLMAMP